MTDVETRQPRTRRRLRGSGFHLRVASGLAVVATLILAVALANRFGTDPDLVASPLIDKPAPDLTMPSLDGQGELTASELSGQLVVVNFWASWCVACRAEHDDLVATAAAFKERGVTFVGVVY